MKKILSLMLLSLFGAGAFAGGARQSAPAEKPMIAVSILPQGYFVQRIAGDLVDRVVLVGEGQSPHAYEPSPKQMGDLAKSKAWILSNSDFELSLRPKIAAQYPSLLIVDGTEGVKFRKMEDHSHEGEEDQAAEATGVNIDRHTWLGRAPARIMAGHIRDALGRVDPANKQTYDANYQALLADIDREFNALVPALAPLKGQAVFVFHPAFGYFLDEFGIQQEAVETGGKEPTAKALSALIDEARKDGVKVIFVQAQFPTQAATTLANAIGAQVLPLDPLAPDWLDNIRRIGATLQKAARQVQ